MQDKQQSLHSTLYKQGIKKLKQKQNKTVAIKVSLAAQSNYH